MLAEQFGDAEPHPTRGGLQIHVSKLLLASTLAAIASSVALVVAAVMIEQGPGPGPGPGQPPPPPILGPIVTVIVIAGMFVISWVAVLATLARDQVLRRVQDQPRADAADLLARLRATLADDRRTDLAGLENRMATMVAEYGEQRETDGYVNGMRAATRAGAEVRPLYRLPPA